MTDPAVGEKIGFRAVKADIRQRIAQGDWGRGGQLPGEVVLASEYGVARATMNRALRSLAEDGLIDRRRRGGTRVLPAPRREARFAIPIVRAEVEATGAVYGYRLLRQNERSPEPRVLTRLGLETGERTRYVLALHSADGRPWQLEERWISLPALPEAHAQSFEQIAPTEWLIATVPYSDVEVSLLADAASPDWAEFLDMRPGAPVFVVERTTWLDGRAITHVRLYHADGYRMTTRY